MIALPLTELTSAAPAGVARLTRRLARGDEEAFREFHAEYFSRLHQFLIVVTRGDDAQAKDALQETFLRVARSVKPFDDDEIFWCWLKTVARNAARDGGRRQFRYFAVLERFARKQEVETAPDPSLNEMLEEAMGELGPDERRLLEGKYLDGESVRDLSASAGLTEKAVESRLGRLRRQLRDRMMEKLKSR
ncbi:MAG TPA: sigma-70 family RNA polymerase sigma factor [Verrucomicrobiae bacterium]|nr:sigma-70 family RNA polymerase sigma factor [Verrucomicrobiae bacterium]